MRQETLRFQKGINERIDPYKAEPNRIFGLKNARISDRGNTMSVARIEGFLEKDILNDIDISRIFDITFSSNQDMMVYYIKTDGTTKIKIFDVTDRYDDPLLITTFDLGVNPGLDNGEMLLQHTTIFISPFNKMINFISGEYFFNDFVPDYPRIQAGEPIA